MYPALKHLHVTCAALSLGLFLLRGWWMVRFPARLQRRWVRVLPHVIDTVLLASAIALMFVIRQWPFYQDWLTAKVIGLVVYIALGTIALKRGRTMQVRVLAFIAAVAVFLWIVATARLHTPWVPDI
ncbi:MAG: SirB2 family protein [Gammaproteobacteria bacterium]